MTPCGWSEVLLVSVKNKMMNKGLSCYNKQDGNV